MTRAVLVIRDRLGQVRTITTTAAGEAVTVALTHDAQLITVVAMCDIDGCTHPPAHNGPHRFHFDEAQT